jgi:hypothetical protein
MRLVALVVIVGFVAYVHMTFQDVSVQVGEPHILPLQAPPNLTAPLDWSRAQVGMSELQRPNPAAWSSLPSR